MSKRGNDRNCLRNVNSKNRRYENEGLSAINEDGLKISDIRLNKSDSALSLINNPFDCCIPKKIVKMSYNSEEMRGCAAIRMSHIVIVDSVLNETNIDCNLEAILPFTLNDIYQKFKSSKKYIEDFRAKEQFYRGVGLFGIGIEERIYNKRKILEETFQRGIRLRPHPKPKRQFDETIINSSSKNIKVKYNVFTIGTDTLKRSSRRHIGKSIKKKSIVRRQSTQKQALLKKVESESLDNRVKTVLPKRSLALSRTKRKSNVPHLDFKYCYNDGDGVIRGRRPYNVSKEDEYMEIVDSDSSSVVEISPPIRDKENNEYPQFKHNDSKCFDNPEKGLPQKENKALNLLDKLRLGLQCSVIHTDDDVIIHHLTVEDLSTLRRRLQGLATFKNIEAEYDNNGQETARATIDRKVLNLPQMNSVSLSESRICFQAFKKRMLASIEEKKRTLALAVEKDKDKEVNSTWVRPKVRFVKKIRKLYTQSASTPNILARSQTQGRPETTSRASTKCQSSNIEATNTGHSAPVSFYPQISSSVCPESCVIDLVKPEPRVVTEESSIEPITPIVSTTTSAISDSNSTPFTTCSVTTGTPATAMSASQLLMLRKGTALASSTCNSAAESPNPSTACRSDQMLTNHILQPLKKSIHSSSPAKLEIDEEDGENEHAPAQSTQTSSQGDVTTPRSMLQSVSGPSVSLVAISDQILPTRHALIMPGTATRLVPCTRLPIVTSANNNVSVSPGFRIKHRKWTHNFLTSNSINFREVLCTSSPGTGLAPRPALIPLTPLTPVTSVMSLTNHSSQAKLSSVTPVPSVMSPANPPSQVKASSVVLKSLLVGTTSASGTDNSNIMGNRHQINGAVTWTPQYLSGNGFIAGQDPKIKWQVGGTVVSTHTENMISNRQTSSQIPEANLDIFSRPCTSSDIPTGTNQNDVTPDNNKNKTTNEIQSIQPPDNRTCDNQSKLDKSHEIQDESRTTTDIPGKTITTVEIQSISHHDNPPNNFHVEPRTPIKDSTSPLIQTKPRACINVKLPTTIDIRAKPQKNNTNLDIQNKPHTTLDIHSKPPASIHMIDKLNTTVEFHPNPQKDNIQAMPPTIASDIQPKLRTNLNIQAKPRTALNIQAQSDTTFDIKKRPHLNEEIQSKSQNNNIIRDIQGKSHTNLNIQARPCGTPNIQVKHGTTLNILKRPYSTIEIQSKPQNDHPTLEVQDKPPITMGIKGVPHPNLEIQPRLQKDRKTVDIRTQTTQDIRAKAHTTLNIETKPHTTLDIKAKSNKTFDIKAKPLMTLDIEAKSHKTLDVKAKADTTLDIKAKPQTTLNIQSLPRQNLAFQSRLQNDYKTFDITTKPPTSLNIQTKLKTTLDIHGRPHSNVAIHSRPHKDGIVTEIQPRPHKIFNIKARLNKDNTMPNILPRPPIPNEYQPRHGTKLSGQARRQGDNHSL